MALSPAHTIWAQGEADGPAAHSHAADFDARHFHPGVQKNAASLEPTARQKAALQAAESAIPTLAVDFDATTGVAGSVRAHTGYLSLPNSELDPETIALNQIVDLRELLGLTEQDLLGPRAHRSRGVVGVRCHPLPFPTNV